MPGLPASTRSVSLRRVAVASALGAVLVVSWIAVNVRPSALLDAESAAAVWKFARGLFPPNLTLEFLGVVARAAGQTVAIALAGTAISIIFALPLGVLATPTLWQHGVLLAGERRRARGFLLAGMSRTTSAFLGFLRAVPDLMWGLFFVVAVGLGPLAGTLALAVSYSGLLGRVYADVFEDADPRALEALHAAGATRAQVFLRGVWPQAAPSITAYTLYSFECCVRAAAVLGFIGAGGIGYEINISMRMFEYGEVLTLIAALVGLVAITDYASRWVRRNLHANVPAGSLAHQHLANESTRWRWLGSHARARRSLSGLGIVAALAASFYAVGFFSGSLLDVNLIARVKRFAGGLLPPDLSPAFLSSLGLPLVQTIGISVIGSLIGIGIGSVLALPATSTLVLAESDQAGRRSILTRSVRWAVFSLTRLALNVLRSIPELVWVLICILAVGLGPFAGALAIGLHTGGVLGKLYAETLEEVPQRPLEALRAGGARPLQVLAWGMVPQAIPTLVSYTVLRWEMNLRVSTILGLVGGGGLGQAIYNNVQLGFYERMGTLIVITYGLVVGTDWVSRRLRSRRAAL